MLIVSSGAEVTTDPFVSSFVATSKSSNSGTVSINCRQLHGSTIDMTLSSAGGYNLIGGASVDNFKGSSGNDTFTIVNSGEGDTDIYDGLGGTDILQLSAGSHVFASDANFKNIETVLANTAGSSVNLSAQTEGFTITGKDGVDIIIGGEVMTLLLVELVMTLLQVELVLILLILMQEVTQSLIFLLLIFLL